MLAAPVLALALTSACQSVPAPSAEDRAAYGAIAIVDSREEAARSYDVPTTGWFMGLGHGTVRGLGAAVGLTVMGAAYGAPLGPLGMLAGAVVGCAAGVVYTPFSIIAGAATAADRSEIEPLRPAFEAAVLDPALPAYLVEQFESAARAQHGIVPVSRAQATTICELTLESIEFGSSSEGLSVDAEFGVKVTASVRLVRATDGSTVWEGSSWAPNPEGERHKFVVWAANDAALARHDVHVALQLVATHLAQVVFTGGP